MEVEEPNEIALSARSKYERLDDQDDEVDDNEIAPIDESLRDRSKSAPAGLHTFGGRFHIWALWSLPAQFWRILAIIFFINGKKMNIVFNVSLEFSRDCRSIQYNSFCLFTDKMVQKRPDDW